MKLIKKLLPVSLKNWLKQLLDYRFLLFTGQPQYRFVIFGQGRTGSTLLTKLLNMEGDIFCDTELSNKGHFGKVVNLRFFTIARMKKYTRRNVRAYGFRCKIYELEKDQKTQAGPYLEWLQKRGFKIIYLRRNNLFLQSLSNFRANHTKKYHVGKEDKQISKTLYIEPSQMESYIRGHQQYLQQELVALEGFEYLVVEYETHLADEKQLPNTINHIRSFIGLAPVASSKGHAPLKKTSSLPPEKEIENYHEIKGHLIRHGLGHYLQ